MKLCLIAFACNALPLCAQLDTATITGTVTDSAGVVVANAAVTVTNSNQLVKPAEKPPTKKQEQ